MQSKEIGIAKWYLNTMMVVIVSRSLQDQINDLDVYCSFGLKWSEVANDFVQDADGCREMVKYSKQI